ncbi:MAG: RNA methyltransferase [Ruminococcaceae bacterium]|nr:RNA methyltransferase [Oscillospiraceae bacterium]
MEVITSRANPKIQFALSLRDKKARKENGMFYFEGKKLFMEAIAKSVPLTSVFCTEDHKETVQKALWGKDTSLYIVPESVYNKLTEEKAPEGIFCLAKTIDKYHNFATIYIPDEKSGKLPPARLMLCSLRDPGNLGTVLRSAAAFGCRELILSKDCADIYNSKTVRASMGMLFDRYITVVDDPIGTIRALAASGQTVLATALHRDSFSLFSVKEPHRVCFVIGNEGQGLSDEIIHACHGSVIIPMMEGTESLNASIAASVLLYEQFRHMQ